MADTTGKVIECKAAVIWEPKQPLSIETIEVAPPKAGEVRIKIVATGACHSDWNCMQGEDPFAKYPIIPGHEGAGIVESIGEGVTSVEAGDHVIMCFIPQCRDCVMCKDPRTNLCLPLRETVIKGVMLDGTMRFKCKGKEIHHFAGCSSFSEYTVASEMRIIKINPKAPLDKACLMACGIPTGYGAAINSAKVEPGSMCAVWGLGAVGLACIMGCKAAGASRIIGIDINPDKFETAKQFGATECMNPKDYDKPMTHVLIGLSGGLGVDFTFECCGNVKTMREALESSRRGTGVSTIVGMAAPGKEIATIPYMLSSGRTWKGTLFGGYKSRDSIPKLIDEYLEGKLMVDEFISHTVTLDDINKAFDLMKSGNSIRSVITIQQ